MTRVKICGITNLEDLVIALDLGADAIGFVLEQASSRYVSPEQVRGLVGYVGPYCSTVAVYGKYVPAETGTTWSQAVDFGESSPKNAILALRPRNESAADLMQLGEAYDSLLIDAYSSQANGGTGERADWSLAAELTKKLSKPLILAGGLTPENVAEAIQTVHPYAVDVSSGVESSPGKKDPAKLRDFIAAVRSIAHPAS